METFYLSYDEFWDWFNRENDDLILAGSDQESNQRTRVRNYSDQFHKIGEKSDEFSSPKNNKRPRMDTKPRHIVETEAAHRVDARYIIMYGPHKPGKKNKVWEGDGYLSLVGQIAHLCDLKGRMLEEPTYLDDIDHSIVQEMGELLIGNTEVQVVDIDKKN